MDALRLTLRAELRRRWRPMLGLALLLGVIGGVVLTAAAGARRTDTAYPRLLRSARAAQLLLISDQHSPAGYYTRLSRLPQVAGLSVASSYDTLLPGPHGPSGTLVETFSSPDDSFGVTGDRVRILSGRVFDARDPHAVMIDQQLAAREHLHPGGTLRLFVVPSDKAGNPQPSRARLMSFKVSAIAVFDTQIVPASRVNAEPMALVSPPFAKTPLALSASFGLQAGARLRPGASAQSVVQAATILARRYPRTQGVSATNLADEITATQRAIRPQAITLALFAALTGLVALAVIGQLLSRQLTLDSAEFPVLRTLGMTRRGLLALALARLAVVTAVAALVAVVIAIAASPLMPIGPARVAEPAPGVSVNASILAPGAVAIIVLPLLLLLHAAWRAAARVPGPLGVAEPDTPARASRLGALLARSGPVTGSVGLRMAFEPGHGRTAVPVRTALVGTVVAVTSVVAALVFGASLHHLVSTPPLYGQAWQQQLDLEFGAVRAPLVTGVLARQPGLAGYAIGNYGQVTVGGRIVPAIGVAPVRGRGFVTLLAGRPPAGPDQIAFGARTLRALHRRVGQRIQVLVNGKQRNMRITGTAVLASFNRGGFDSTDLGNGAVLAPPVLSQPNLSSGCPARFTCYSFALLRYQPGTDLAAAAGRLVRVTHRHGCPPGSCVVVSDQRPSDIRDYAGVRNTPLLLGVVLALLAVGTLTHVLLTSVRRRGRDLAMLKSLGLVRRQVLAVVEWQAAALAITALLLGVPLGVLAGRWAWALFAGSAGVSATATVPVRLVLATIPVTVVLAMLIAAWPGRTAARVRPAAALRAE
jgi:ABC-type antimicrobial peptide transport system permease subunit